MNDSVDVRSSARMSLAEIVGDAWIGRQTVLKGHRFYTLGSEALDVFQVISGHVALSVPGERDDPVIIDVATTGRVIGLSAALGGLPMTTDAVALSDCVVATFNVRNLKAIADSRPAISTLLFRAAAEETACLAKTIVSLKVRPLVQRLGHYLLESMPPDRHGNTAAFRLPYSKGLLANVLGCVPENLSRAFQTLRYVGVETSGSRVIFDVADLRAFCERRITPALAPDTADA